VPEGKLDFDWLTVLTRVVELDRESEEPCLFGVRVGLIPTTDVRMRETCEALSKAHPHIVALVDGDGDGALYAANLRDPAAGVEKVLCWPDQWTIEDVIGWIVGADETPVMARLNRDLAVAPGTLAAMVAALKSLDRGQNRLKGDLVAYEIIANALSDHPHCIQRARTVLNAIAQVCAGEATPHFVVSEEGQVPKLVFRPCP
jgi:hypothetical protein